MVNLKGINLIGCPKLAELLDNLTRLFENNLSDRTKTQNFILINKLDYVYVTRSGFDLLTLAYNDAIDKQNKDAENYALGTLILKSSSAIGGNTILNKDYIEEIANWNKKIDVDQILSCVKNSMPGSFGILTPKNIGYKSNSANIIFTGVGYDGNVKQMGMLSRIYDEMSDSITAIFNGPFTVLPVSVMRGIFIDEPDLAQLSNKPLFDQPWFAKLSYSDGNKAMFHLLVKKLKDLTGRPEHEFNDKNPILSYEASVQDVLQNRERFYAKMIEIAEPLILTPWMMEDFDINGVQHMLVKIDEYKYITLHEYKAISDVLKNVWNRVKSFAFKAKDIFVTGIKTVKKLTDAIEDKYGLKVDDIINFIDNGPTAFSEDKDWAHISKQVALNILPVLSEYLKSNVTNQYNTSKLRNKIDEFLKRDMEYFNAKSSALSRSRRSLQHKIIRIDNYNM